MTSKECHELHSDAGHSSGIGVTGGCGAPVTRCHSQAGDQAAAQTAARWPVRVWVKAPEAMSHSTTCAGGRGGPQEAPVQ